MRRLSLHASGLNRIKDRDAILVGTKPSKVAILACRIRLPHLDQGIVHRSPIAVQYPANQSYLLAGAATKIHVRSQAQMEKRPDGLRRRWNQIHTHFPNGVASHPRSTMLN